VAKLESSNPYDAFKCPVCGVPWYSYSKDYRSGAHLRWPIHTRDFEKCRGVIYKPVHPEPETARTIAINATSPEKKGAWG
jgi:hypothetical protein